MNEITKIHLGRQPFTISVDAHKDLRAYLEAIEVEVGAKSDVLKEIEVRMAELLGERGISGDKVILSEDVAFLREQLGEPRDFKEDSDESETTARPADETQGQKRLFRDTQNGMLAGVSSGLAAYLGIDAVIVRLAFVLITIMGGWGFLLYVILWLIVPEAKTTSERLQMRGKAVTVDSLKELVDRADVPGAGRRAQKVVGPAIERIGKILLTIVGVGFIAFGAITFFGGVASGLCALLYQQDILQGASFDVSAGDYAFVGAIVAITAVIGLFSVLIGSALVRRKWQLPGWATAGLLGVFFVGVTVATVMAPGFMGKVQDYRDSAKQVKTRQLTTFSELKLLGSDQFLRYNYVPSEKYAIEMTYIGQANSSDIKTDIQNMTLVVDTRKYDDNVNCKTICLIPRHDMQLTIYAPQLKTITTQGENVSLVITEPLQQDSVVAEAKAGSVIAFSKIAVGNAVVTANSGMEAVRVAMSGIKPAGDADSVMVHTDTVSMHQPAELTVDTDKRCVSSSGTISDPIVMLDAMPNLVTVNGKATTNISTLTSLGQKVDEKNPFYCVAFTQ